MMKSHLRIRDFFYFSFSFFIDKKYAISRCNSTEVPDGYALHHDTKNGNLQLVKTDWHKTFTYAGGHSLFKDGVSSDLRGMCGIGKVKFSLDAVCAEEIHGTSYLAIGVDSFGNDILINLSDGAIAFKDHENGQCRKIADSLKAFLAGCVSRPINKSAIKSVEERERDLIARGRGAIITDALRDMWRVEINKYSALSQEKVVL